MAKEISRRDKVVNTALKLISNGGFHASPMSELAKLSGVAVGTIYHHFPSKEDLFESLYVETCTEAARALHETLSVKGKETQRLTSAWLALCGYFSSAPLRYLAVIQYRNSPLYSKNKEMEDAFSALTALLKEGQKTGKFKKMNVAFQFEHFLSSVFAVVRLKTVEKKKISEKEVREMADAIIQSIRK